MFETDTVANSLLLQASANQDGQFGYDNHDCLLSSHSGTQALVACIALWHSEHSSSFQQQTITSLANNLSADSLRRVMMINSDLLAVFAPPQASELCLGHVSVVPAYRTLGLATRLIEHAVLQADKLGKSKLVLDVECSNLAAISCYTKNGFELEKKSRLANTQYDFFRMARFLV